MNYEEFRRALLDRVDLVALVERQVGPIRRSGKVFKCKCPFHDDSTASFAVYPDGGWTCFGACNESGNAIDYVIKRDNCDFMRAVELLAGEVGLEVPKFNNESPERKQARLDAQQIMNLAANYYHTALMKLPAAEAHREYLRKRGFSNSETWQRWRLGAAGNGNGLVQYFQQQGVNLALAEEIGLINKNLHDHFRERIVIPFLENGDVVYFTARSISGAEPKYLHIQNSAHARKTPFNHRTSAKRAVVVEGPLDVFAVEEIAPDGVGAIGLMGLAHSDPVLEKALRRRDVLYVGLDSDGTVRQEIVDGVALIAPERARIIGAWPGGDDAAKWVAGGQATSEEFGSLLAAAPKWLDTLLDDVRKAETDNKAAMVRRAINAAGKLADDEGDVYASGVKKAANGSVQAKTINSMLREARLKQRGLVPASAQAKQTAWIMPYSIDDDGNLIFGKQERITTGGHAYYDETVLVDDGIEQKMELQIAVNLAGGQTRIARVPAQYSGDENRVLQEIKAVTGPLLTVEAGQRKHLIPAIEQIGRDRGIRERTELMRTGWVRFEDEWIFCTPGGTVGVLPPGYSVVLPKGFEQFPFKVVDQGDEAFREAINGITGLLAAFDESVIYPVFAFALCAIAEPFLPGGHKFAMHLVGETGSLKTSTAKVIQAMFGIPVESPPLQTWRSTVNAIEVTGHSLPNVVGVVDDYKPSIVPSWEFTQLIQRYADGNARIRLDSRAQVRSRQAMRWWLLSTGEDLPVGEASVHARMVTVRFPRREIGNAFNVQLAKGQKAAKYFPTFTARFADFLRQNAARLELTNTVDGYQQQIADRIQKDAPDTPNVNRIARNWAFITTVWLNAFVPFLEEVARDTNAAWLYGGTDFEDMVLRAAVGGARIVSEEKPVRVFIDAIQSGVDSGRFKILYVGDASSRGQGLIGYFDEAGVYILAAAFDEVAKWRREIGQQIGFSRGELYKLLASDGLLVNGHPETVVKKIGKETTRATVRALHLKRGALDVRTTDND